MFQKILFPTDGSENSKKAMEYVSNFAVKFDSKIIILHCYELPLVEHYPYYISNKELEERILEASKVILEKTKSEFEKSGIKFEEFLKEGKARELIIQTAESEGCDLIIMGNRGLGATKSILLGSVSNYVIHYSKCPVMLINSPSGD